MREEYNEAMMCDPPKTPAMSHAHTPAPWTWWTSNSWKRLLHDLGHGRSANVLQPYVCHDGHPDCEVSDANMNLIAAAPELFEYVKSSASAGCATAKMLIEKIESKS